MRTESFRSNMGVFTPLVFSTSGGMGPSASVFFKRLASLLSVKKNAHYGSVMAWIRCKISFALIHSAVLCRSPWSSLPSCPVVAGLRMCTFRVPNCPSCSLTVYICFLIKPAYVHVFSFNLFHIKEEKKKIPLR